MRLWFKIAQSYSGIIAIWNERVNKVVKSIWFFQYYENLTNENVEK